MARKNKGRDISGIVLLDKPLGISSNKALQILKSLYKAQKAGHTGSLDPLASGLLPVCFGEATKFSQYFLNAEKMYEGRIQFGQRTSTGDSEGDVLEEREVDFAFEVLVEVMSEFIGEQKQVPSMYSALKHEGQPLYKLARMGLEVERDARDIVIHELRLKSERHLFENQQQVDIYVHCSKGTYIRNLAEDIGERAGCGAHLKQLRRVGLGDFTEMESLDVLRACFEKEGFAGLDTKLIPVDQALMQFPELELDAQQAFQIKQGALIHSHEGSSDLKGIVRLYADEASGIPVFLGLGEFDVQGSIKAKRLLRTN